MAASVSELVQSFHGSGGAALYEKNRRAVQTSGSFQNFNSVPDGVYVIEFYKFRADVNKTWGLIINLDGVIKHDPARGADSLYVGKQGGKAIFAGPPKEGSHEDALNSGLIATLQTLGFPTGEHDVEGLFLHAPRWFAENRPNAECVLEHKTTAAGKDVVNVYINRLLSKRTVESAPSQFSAPPPSVVGAESGGPSEAYDPEDSAPFNGTVPTSSVGAERETPQPLPAGEEHPEDDGWRPNVSEVFVYRKGSSLKDNPVPEAERSSCMVRVESVDGTKVSVQPLDAGKNAVGRRKTVSTFDLQ
jgi:hypothetical protein